MVKRVCLIFVLLFTTFSFGASEFDKDIVVKNQTRNDKVKAVFREMMSRYEEEDLNGFFSYVLEDRFHQDYMTFYDAIDQDIRVYDILSVDTWVDKITEDGVKRFLYVRWEKRYESSSSDTEITQLGYSRFLFDEVNGKYKLIELAGNNFWGGSLPEWREEVGDIAGQESKVVETTTLPDLVIISATSDGSLTVTTIVKNQGEANIPSGVEIKVTSGFDSNTYSGGLAAGDTISITTNDYNAGTSTVDPDNTISESDETNNVASVVVGP